MPLRVAAISFLNPAPLLYDFQHEPAASALSSRYALHFTSPAACARELQSGDADLGLIPIASLTPELTIVPGCAIASLHEVRSILLLIKNPDRLPPDQAMRRVRTVASDAASRSSTAYVRILFERFHQTHPTFLEHAAEPAAMLAVADACLLIGDPALLAREHRAAIDAAAETFLLWMDVAALWREHTGLPWVAAVWAIRAGALERENLSPQQLTADLNNSRDHGLAHVEDLVREWTPRLALAPETIRTYLTHNIHYRLDPECVAAVRLFRSLAAEMGALPPLPELRFLADVEM